MPAYDILEAPTREDLIRLVHQRLIEGWHVTGGHQVTCQSTSAPADLRSAAYEEQDKSNVASHGRGRMKKSPAAEPEPTVLAPLTPNYLWTQAMVIV